MCWKKEPLVHEKIDSNYCTIMNLTQDNETFDRKINKSVNEKYSKRKLIADVNNRTINFRKKYFLPEKNTGIIIWYNAILHRNYHKTKIIF